MKILSRLLILASLVLLSTNTLSHNSIPLKGNMEVLSPYEVGDVIPVQPGCTSLQDLKKSLKTGNPVGSCFTLPQPVPALILEVVEEYKGTLAHPPEKALGAYLAYILKVKPAIPGAPDVYSLWLTFLKSA